MQQPVKRSTRDRFLGMAENFAYDLVGLPVAIAYLLGQRQLPPDASPAAHIRALYCRHYWSRAGGVLRGLLAGLVWPFGFAVYAMMLTSRNGANVRTLNGKSII